MSRIAVLAALVPAIAVTAIVFYFVPSIDLDVAAGFYVGRNTFVGQTSLGEAVRKIAYWVPTIMLVLCAAFYAARRFGWWRGWAPTGRGLVMLAVSLAIGPGLLTNTVLKDHSHRPRPYQTVQFGGQDAFRPFYTFDGACARNCSFVSGEGSAAAWTIAPALLAPPPLRLAAVLGALAFTLGAGTLRMAFGGHYLSDTIFAVLFTWTVIWTVWALLLGRSRGWRARGLVLSDTVGEFA